MVKVKPQVSLGTAIWRRREGLKISQDAFADTISMHRAYYSAIERGAKNLPLRVLIRVAEGLRSKVSELFPEAGY
jgi:transcriptional regulator with XRE-family HTH domain